MKITIGFSKPKAWYNLLSYAIRFAEGTPYSHTYAKFHSDSLDRDLIYQAHGTQVNFIGSKRFADSVCIVKEFHVDVTEEQKKVILQFCVDNAGSPYGVAQLFGFILVKLFKIKNPFTRGMVCSEVSARLLSYLGYDVGDPNNADLKTVYRVLETK